MQHSAAVKRSADSVTAFRARPLNASSADSASAAVQRGRLGIHLNRSSQDLAAEKKVALALGQRF